MQVVIDKNDLKELLLDNVDVIEDVIKEFMNKDREFTLKEICELTGLNYHTVMMRKIQLHPAVVKLRSTNTKTYLYQPEAKNLIKQLYNAGYRG